ncbi:4-hydroxy-tetrahydrodipicolinate synthase [Saccharibacillus sp. CPCC 101409]|uniref:4-hydroxy-tetrahydrodipicolinate synthase n=1 Tax=Saccharibacillus sp. CPCC 101409 TaxID=3058041 RepID=UPI002671160A|nr:4-hydroxy-tetrahydrodipicolinate synthase [Saccharibacillus sp. CPCC 101409]MDO3411126.1 4-hydroxy-tetrahydrodipicolinate synthase [Saccharibacillus sp. CPCC 101409]
MLQASQIKGIIAAMVTPFDDNREIHAAAAGQLVDRLIGAGVAGIFILGTNGEFHMLSEAEKLAFAEIVIHQVGGRVPVYAGAGGNSTKEVVRLAREMERLGADALSVITPYFLPLTQAELAGHYRAVAESVSTPIVLYNIPKNTGMNLEPETVRELARIGNIVGIKDSSGSLERIERYVEASAGEEFVVLSGSDSLILKALKAGASGAIAATANLITELDVSIYDHYVNGDLDAAERAQAEIEPFRAVLKLGTVPSILKKSIELSGIPVGPARAPVGTPGEETVRRIKDMLGHYHL